MSPTADRFFAPTTSWEQEHRRVLARIGLKPKPPAWLEWGGSPWGSGAIEKWLACGFRTAQGIEAPFVPAMGARVGGLVQLGLAHALITPEIEARVKRRAALEFRKWRQYGLPGAEKYVVPSRRWRKLTPAEFAKLNPDMANPEFRWRAQVVETIECFLAYFEAQGWEAVEIEFPITSDELFTFHSTVPGTEPGTWRLDARQMPATTFGDFLFKRPGKRRLLHLDVKTTSRPDLVGLTEVQLTSALNVDAQGAIHQLVSAERDWKYARLYASYTGSYKLRVKDPLIMAYPRPEKMIKWLRGGVVSGYKHPGYSTCQSCVNRRVCWGGR